MMIRMRIRSWPANLSSINGEEDRGMTRSLEMSKEELGELFLTWEL